MPAADPQVLTVLRAALDRGLDAAGTVAVLAALGWIVPDPGLPEYEPSALRVLDAVNHGLEQLRLADHNDWADSEDHRLDGGTHDGFIESCWDDVELFVGSLQRVSPAVASGADPLVC